jgi:hypothetical protein
MERPRHVVQAMEAAAVEGILDSANCVPIRGLEQVLPLTVEPALQPTDREEVGASKGGQDGLEDGERKDQGAEPGRPGADAAGGGDGPLDDGGGQEGDSDGDCGYGGRDGEREGLEAVEGISDGLLAEIPDSHVSKIYPATARRTTRVFQHMSAN